MLTTNVFATTFEFTMPDRNTLRSVTRLTSAARLPDPERTRALHRALYVQQARIHGVFVNAANLVGITARDTRARQEALCTLLEQNLTEARALLEAMPDES